MVNQAVSHVAQIEHIDTASIAEQIGKAHDLDELAELAHQVAKYRESGSIDESQRQNLLSAYKAKNCILICATPLLM